MVDAVFEDNGNSEPDISDAVIDKYFESEGEYDLESAVTSPEDGSAGDPPSASGDAPSDPPQTPPTPSPQASDGTRDELMRTLNETVQLLKAQSERQPQDPGAPEAPEAKQDKVTYEDYPLEFLKQQNEELRQQLSQLVDSQKQIQTRTEQQTEQQKLVTAYRQAADSVMQEKPDFSDAYQHAFQSRVKEYATLGHSEADATRMTMEDEYAIVEQATKNGKNPAQVVYDMAVLRGYQPKTAASEGKTIKKSENTGAPPKPKSLTGVGKSPGDVDASSLEALVNLDGEDFEKAFNKMFAG